MNILQWNCDNFWEHHCNPQLQWQFFSLWTSLELSSGVVCSHPCHPHLFSIPVSGSQYLKNCVCYLFFSENVVKIKGRFNTIHDLNLFVMRVSVIILTVICHWGMFMFILDTKHDFCPKYQGIYFKTYFFCFSFKTKTYKH